MSHYLAARLGVFKLALVLPLLPLTAGLCHGASITYTNPVSGNPGSLLGAGTLPMFDPSLGTLTGATFQLSSAVTGNVVMQGTLANGVCGASTGVTVVISVSGTNGDLSNTVNQNFQGQVGTAQNNCVTTSPFTQTMNAGPTPALQSLSSYIGTGNLAYTFTVTNLSNAAWNGTETVVYNFTASTPEPSTAVLGLSGLLGLFALRRRYSAK